MYDTENDRTMTAVARAVAITAFKGDTTHMEYLESTIMNLRKWTYTTGNIAAATYLMDVLHSQKVTIDIINTLFGKNTVVTKWIKQLNDPALYTASRTGHYDSMVKHLKNCDYQVTYIALTAMMHRVEAILKVNRSAGKNVLSRAEAAYLAMHNSMSPERRSTIAMDNIRFRISILKGTLAHG